MYIPIGVMKDYYIVYCLFVEPIHTAGRVYSHFVCLFVLCLYGYEFLHRGQR